MSSDSSGAEQGTLVVWVPHWAATVRLFDNEYNPVATLSAQTDAEQGRYPIRFQLQPGVYRVDVELSGASDSEWVSIRARKETTIPAERWSSLQPQSATPLAPAAASAPATPAQSQTAAWATEAEQWSRQATWTSSRPGAARLFIFVQTPNITKYPEFARGLSLLDEQSSLLVRLADTAVHVDPTAGWLAFNTDLAGGFYILARDGPGTLRYNLPLYLCDTWETQLFLAGGNGPSFRSLTTHMAPRGHGFRRDDEVAAASDAVLAALRREADIATLVTSAHLKRLLHAEHRNPWLAVLAAYALTLAEDGGRRANAPAGQLFGDPVLKQDILQFLNATIGMHPDVRALGLDPQAPPPSPFAVPPLLRVGLERVQQHATRFATTVPLNSLCEKALAQLVTSSPWSVWNEPLAAPKSVPKTATRRAAGVAATAAAKPVRQGARRVANLSPSAPVFRLTTWGKETKTMDLRRAFYDLPLFKAAQDMISTAAQPQDDKIVVNPTAAAGELLSDIQPEALSLSAGIPLSRVQFALDQMKTRAATAPPGAASKGTPTERAILQYVLRQGATAASKNSQNDPTAQKPSIPASSLEEAIAGLRNAAVLLLADDKPPETAPPGTSVSTDNPNQPDLAVRKDPAVRARAQALSARFQRLADALLAQSDVIVVTDPAGKFLYGNGAFALLVSDRADVQTFVASGQKWFKWLQTLPLGRISGLTSPADAKGRTWTVRRAAVEDHGTKRQTAFINVLQDTRHVSLPDAAFEYLASATSQIVLQVSFVQYASGRRMTAALTVLEEIASRLEGLIPSPGGAK